MIYTFLKIGFLFLLTFSFSSCIKEVIGVKLPEESKLIVTSFISPDQDTMRVYVRESEPAGKVNSARKYLFYKDAQVMLSDGNQSIKLVYREQFVSGDYYIGKTNYTSKNLEGFYYAPASSFKIEYGKTYYLEVTDPTGRKATASCTVPIQFNYTSEPQIEWKENTIDPEANNEYDLYIRWDDIPNQANYFRIKDLVGTYTYPCKNTDGSVCKDKDGNPIFNQKNSLTYFSSETDFTDDRKDPNSLLLLKAGLVKPDSTINPKEMSIIFKYDLIEIDENYYQYLKTNLTYLSGGIPFSEPSYLYSNVEGGLGIFGAYTVLINKK